MQEDSHNYKALTIISDSSFQYLKGKEVFHREGNTHTHNEIKKLGHRQGWEQSYRERSHREHWPPRHSPGPQVPPGALASEAQSMAARSARSVSRTVFLQAMIASPPASLKSLLSYTLQAKSKFSAGS